MVLGVPGALLCPTRETGQSTLRQVRISRQSARDQTMSREAPLLSEGMRVHIPQSSCETGQAKPGDLNRLRDGSSLVASGANKEAAEQDDETVELDPLPAQRQVVRRHWDLLEQLKPRVGGHRREVVDVANAPAGIAQLE